MASSKQYLNFVLEQLSELSDVTHRAMMGEYVIYYRGKIVGVIYDDRFLVKPVKTAITLMPFADYEIPYKGAKEMLMVNIVSIFSSSYVGIRYREFFLGLVTGISIGCAFIGACTVIYGRRIVEIELLKNFISL